MNTSAAMTSAAYGPNASADSGLASCANQPAAAAADADGGGSAADDHTKLQLYVVTVLLCLMMLVGATGNALVIYVFPKKRDKQASTLFIVVMAFVDFTTCLFVIPYTLLMEYISFNIKYDALCKLYQFLITSNIPFSALIMAAIAVDRYLCICHPLLNALTLQRAKKVTLALALGSAGLGIMVALMFGVYTTSPATQACDAFSHNTTTTDTASDVVLNKTGIYYRPYDTAQASLDRNVGVGPSAHQDAPAPPAPGLTQNDQQLSENTYQYWEQNKSDAAAGRAASETGSSSKYIYKGQCVSNEIILSDTFQLYFQKFYTAVFVLCLAVVMVLYTLIYRSVRARRKRREKQKSKALPLIENEAATTEMTNTTTVTLLTVNHAYGNGTDDVTAAAEATRKTPPTTVKKKHSLMKRGGKQKTTRKDKLLMANLKTAAMLFVVTVVFIVTYTPAFLMALEILPYNIVIFYMYFANNVANPVIYSFMNKNFRDDLRKVFCGRRR